jgi:hypothetical protein
MPQRKRSQSWPPKLADPWLQHRERGLVMSRAEEERRRRDAEVRQSEEVRQLSRDAHDLAWQAALAQKKRAEADRAAATRGRASRAVGDARRAGQSGLGPRGIRAAARAGAQHEETNPQPRRLLPRALERPPKQRFNLLALITGKR